MLDDTLRYCYYDALHYYGSISAVPVIQQSKFRSFLFSLFFSLTLGHCSINSSVVLTACFSNARERYRPTEYKKNTCSNHIYREEC